MVGHQPSKLAHFNACRFEPCHSLHMCKKTNSSSIDEMVVKILNDPFYDAFKAKLKSGTIPIPTLEGSKRPSDEEIKAFINLHEQMLIDMRQK